MKNPHQKQKIADEYIRLDFTWNEPFEVSLDNIEKGLSTGSMNHVIHGVDTSRQNGTRIGIVTEMEQVTSPEVTAFEDEIRQAALTNGDPRSGDLHTDPGEPNTTCVSAVTVGGSSTNANHSSTIASTQPAIHYAIHDSSCPQAVTPHTLEEFGRNELNKRVDVQSAGTGFNVMIRSATITTENAHAMKQHIVSTENIPHAAVITVYTCPQSGELPEPKP